jgi:hypothetical protein
VSGMLRHLRLLVSRSHGSVASPSPAAICSAVRSYGAAAIRQPCTQLTQQHGQAPAVHPSLMLLASDLADQGSRVDHALSAAQPQQQRWQRPDACHLLRHSNYRGIHHSDHACTPPGGARGSRSSYSNGRSRQHAVGMQSSVSHGAALGRWWQQVRCWSAAVPGNGSKRKGEHAEPNYELSEVNFDSRMFARAQLSMASQLKHAVRLVWHAQSNIARTQGDAGPCVPYR